MFYVYNDTYVSSYPILKFGPPFWLRAMMLSDGGSPPSVAGEVAGQGPSSSMTQLVATRLHGSSLHLCDIIRLLTL